MEEQNPLKRKTWCVRAVPHSTCSSPRFFTKENVIYIAQPRVWTKRLKNGLLPLALSFSLSLLSLPDQCHVSQFGARFFFLNKIFCCSLNPYHVKPMSDSNSYRTSEILGKSWLSSRDFSCFIFPLVVCNGHASCLCRNCPVYIYISRCSRSLLGENCGAMENIVLTRKGLLVLEKKKSVMCTSLKGNSRFVLRTRQKIFFFWSS